MKSSLTQRMARAFPTPQFLFPRSAGIDVSDTSIKWIVFDAQDGTRRLRSWGEQRLESGVITRGAILNESAFVSALSVLREKLGDVRFVHAGLPEEAAYVFSLAVVSGSSREQTLRMIEFEFEGRVPIPASASVYDFDSINEAAADGSVEIGVTVFPRDLAEEYVRAFGGAGFTLQSLEVEAGSIGRALTTSDETDPVLLTVDFGRTRTGFAVLKHGIPIFTSTVEIGGDAMDEGLRKALKLSDEAIETFKREEGLVANAGAKSPGLEALVGTASALAAEIMRHFTYWNTRRDEHGERASPIGRVVVVGESANVRGLCEYIAGRVQAPVVFGNTWQHVFSFDAYVPPIDRDSSLAYVTAAGLALRGI